MAQAVSRRPLTAEAQVRSRVGLCGINGGQSGTGTGFSPSTSVLPCQFHSTGAPLDGKTIKTLIIFITGLHNKPQRCGASVASAAGPFTTKKQIVKKNRHTDLYSKLVFTNLLVKEVWETHKEGERTNMSLGTSHKEGKSDLKDEKSIKEKEENMNLKI
jgi:hypothetical protein